MAGALRSRRCLPRGKGAREGWQEFACESLPTPAGTESGRQHSWNPRSHPADPSRFRRSAIPHFSACSALCDKFQVPEELGRDGEVENGWRAKYEFKGGSWRYVSCERQVGDPKDQIPAITEDKKVVLKGKMVWAAPRPDDNEDSRLKSGNTGRTIPWHAYPDTSSASSTASSAVFGVSPTITANS